jgi:DNA-binding MarR family transcriptional regulator
MAKAARSSYLLRQAQLTVYAEMVERLKSVDLTPVQYMVLSLSDAEGSLSSAELARRAQITPQSMNEVIAAIHRKGLIRRREDPENRRILRVALTKEGTRILAACDRRIDEMEDEIFRCFDRTELTMFRRLLAKLVHAAQSEKTKALVRVAV